MTLNRFNILIFIQILLIALVGILFAFALTKEFMQMTTAGLLLLWVGQILYLNFYMNRIHRDVNKFMIALRNQDTSSYFNTLKKVSYFRGLYTSFNEITKNFRLVRIEKEMENQFFQEMIKQSASGIMAVSEGEKVRLINRAALHLLGVERLSTIPELLHIHPGFSELMPNAHKEPTYVKLIVDGNLVQVIVKSAVVKLQDETVKIYSLLDITREMARNEVEAWQKLIRVLNHEITNSLSPIHILSTSVFDLFHTGEKLKSLEEIDEEVLQRTILGLKTIIKRTGGLSDFLNTYKSFTKTGEPNFSKVEIYGMLKHIQLLMSDEIDLASVDVRLDITPETLEILADEKLLVQTLINLLKNALQAVEGSDKPVIEVKAGQLNDKIFIEVCDNGKGISVEMLDQVFTPFFTTRKNGSGIGLSLARQVMQMHNGSIGINSVEGESTTITLLF